MARDEDFKSRRRREEKEEAQREELTQGAPRPASGVRSRVGTAPARGGAVDSADIDALIRQVEPLLEQLNNLYAMYLSGHERRPPIEKRGLLDTLIARVMDGAKATPAVRFRVQTLYSSYLSHRDRWEKMLKQKETR